MKAHFLGKNMSFYLIAAFLNAFVDLAHKITIQNIIFKTMSGAELLIMTQVVNALILLPFVLFFIPAGELSDNKNKLSNMRFLAIIAIFLCALITLFYALGIFWAAFLATLLLGVQAAFYSPAKYGYAKELSNLDRLAKTNSALQSVSIVAIIFSTLVFTVIFEILTTNFAGSKEEYLQKLMPIGVIMTVLSILEYLSLSKMDIQRSNQQISAMTKLEKYTTILKDNTVFVSIVLLSLFFALSQSVMASFPSFAKEGLGITSALSVQAAMALSAVGVIAGSLVAGNYKNSRHRIAFVFFGMLGYSLFLALVLTGEIYLSFLCIGICAGFIIVPLNTLIQEKIDGSLLGSAISLSNLTQNILMLLFLGVGVAAAISGFEAKNILLICSFLAIMGAVYSSFYFPQAIIEAFVSFLFSFRYKFDIFGVAPRTNGGKILIGNHTSFIDWAFLQMAMDEKIHFLMEKEIYEKPLLKPFLSFFGALPIDSANAKDSIKKAIELLKEGKTIVIFPEGELTKDAQIGNFQKGFELIARRSGADVFTFYLKGLFGSRFSKNSTNTYGSRKVSLFFGDRLEEISAEAAKKAVVALKNQDLN
jgi:acyl-[acyl-carrier-protein]-phospholipid O-acyltransferase / long-chain-fatty-acid--[acyl-carrier-protein] ligase